MGFIITSSLKQEKKEIKKTDGLVGGLPQDSGKNMVEMILKIKNPRI